MNKKIFTVKLYDKSISRCRKQPRLRCFFDLADQLKLTKQELLEFIDGNMTREEYEAILKNKGLI